jgi:hypothetical protein
VSSGVALPQLTNNELPQLTNNELPPLSHSLCSCDSILWRGRGDEDKDTKGGWWGENGKGEAGIRTKAFRVGATWQIKVAL